MYKEYNPNPKRRQTDDCVVRALTLITNEDWDAVYSKLAAIGYELKTMPTTNYTWETYLRRKGFIKRLLPDKCPDCYTVSDFCAEHPQGQYLLATGFHVIAVISGDYYDTWDSGDEIPAYYFEQDKKKEETA